MKNKKSLLHLFLILTVMAVLAGTLLRDNITLAGFGNAGVCTGDHSNSSFNDLIVPEGATCTLTKFNEVDGSIRVDAGATLIVCPDNNIAGSVRAKGATKVFISDQTIAPCAEPKALGVTIGGDVNVKSGGILRLIGNPSGGVAIIEGKVKAKNMQTVEIKDFRNLSTIMGDVKVEQSTNVTVTGNTLGKNLKIDGTSGNCTEQNNTVAGRTDTCP